jgi:hypothetical protein
MPDRSPNSVKITLRGRSNRPIGIPRPCRKSQNAKAECRVTTCARRQDSRQACFGHGQHVIAVLPEHDAGAKTADPARRRGIPEGTLHDRKAEYGGMDVFGAEPSKFVFAGLPAGRYPAGVLAKGPGGGLSESDLTKTTGQGIRVFRPRTLVHPACGSIGAGRSQMPILYNEIKSLIVAAATLRCLAPVPGRPAAAAAGPTAPCDMPLDRRPHRPS